MPRAMVILHWGNRMKVNERAVTTDKTETQAPPPVTDDGAGVPELLKSEAEALSCSLNAVRRALAETENRVTELFQATRRVVTCRTTGLVTRDEGIAVIQRELAHRHLFGGTLSLVLLDIDRFKEFNDGGGGHAAGDQVLATVGEQVLREAGVRGRDFGIRLGGDEIAVVLPGTDEIGAIVVADRIRDAAAAVEIDAKQIRVSVGVARSVDGQTAEELIARADAALYEAKRRGRNQTVIASF
jgi:diguanylate cyclase (GGDEF)-like protein